MPFERTAEVHDCCLCFFTQRAARALGRRFDEVFQPLGLTNGQFSLMVALNQPDPPAMGQVAAILGVDRTTLTAALKPLERRGLVEIRSDGDDKRRRRLILTAPGRSILARAHPLWKVALDEIEARLPAPERLRVDLAELARSS